MLNGLDLFSGIGGLTLALGPWVRPVAYCEVDRYCQSVLLSRQADGALPRAPVWDDVRTLRGDQLPSVDIIYGGFPCQDISVAGRGGGLEGERSGLYWQVLRLVSEVAPGFVFLENVSAIRTRGLRQVVGSLAELGYDCRWTLVSAAEVGAPHLRSRWFLLAAHTERLELRDEQGWGGGARRKGSPFLGHDGSSQSLADADHSRLEGRDGGILCECADERSPRPSRGPRLGGDWWEIEPDVGRVAHGVPDRVDRLRGLGNAVVPAQAREAFRRLLFG